MALNNEPDFIISDVLMPIMNGIDFCSEVRKNIRISHIPFILLTAKVDLETHYKGIEIGADDYIPKPFDMDYLLLRMSNLLQSQDRLRRLFQNGELIDPSAMKVSALDEKFLHSLIESINSNIANPDFTINSLESQLNMSHSTLYRKIKNLTGQSGKELLQSMRMNKARQLVLENKDLRIYEIADMVGFTDATYFSKCFKDLYGYGPSEIRNEK